MTSVCITSEYHTIIYHDARSDPITILVNMPEYVERVRQSPLTPLYHVIALLIKFQLSADWFKTEFILQMYFYSFF